ncbi:uncharacterized protein PFL1_01848 [Pseudozyma flocculosa PF-1]|uniref:FIST domain-containing protein n=1 Tax=Pseudozyma flocculosa TaxID=84751 RepID=A0A5C3EZ89_9BASI|nr:uncharacterized protein PFL1_01848 [Pseudozyma flocculosa PF-1]EPQ30322.1 hypothetical protein PFL1_01848 [Pseudozyma flocculosa PF-1]SPO37392.1 uncharacterized protein PSFLO_02865 [Pseudozyma flocculosa]
MSAATHLLLRRSASAPRISTRLKAPPPLATRRSYAQPASAPPPGTPPPGSPPSQQQQPQWKPKPVLATAQTLTLFSPSPRGLLIALRSTLQGMTNLAARLGPLASNSASAAAPPDHDHVLLYSLSKDLPQQYLSEAVSLLRGVDPSNTEQQQQQQQGQQGLQQQGQQGQPQQQPSPRIARIGLLSAPLPSSLIPSNALEPGAAPISSPTLHSVSLSLLPGVNAVPFRSQIPGRAEIAVGRWPDRKPAWQQGTERRADLLDRAHRSTDTSAADEPAQHTDWRDIWGRENVDGAVPPELDALDPNSVLSLLFFTDPSPQGLIEGFTSRFPRSSVLGLHAPPTPFETGRDHTLLMTLPETSAGGRGGTDAQRGDKIHKDGAVGVALVANVDAQGQKASKEIARPSVEVRYEGLEPFGPRREVTSASGNIITELSSQNAAQQFLRDIQARSAPSAGSSASSTSTPLSANETRDIASTVKKEEAFYIGFFATETASTPLMVSPILSGHPSRGTLSVETEVDLGPGPRGEQGSMKIFAQFFHHPPAPVGASNSGDEGKVEAIEIPGPDASVWTSPRYLFLTSPPYGDSANAATAAAPAAKAAGDEAKKGNHQVFALPNLFIAASEKGWIAGRGAAGPSADQDAALQGGSINLRRDGSSIVECRIPKARVVLSLRGE